jgi:hypothetical protein
VEALEQQQWLAYGFLAGMVIAGRFEQGCMHRRLRTSAD